MNSRTKSILLTGAAGFIGSHVLESLLAQNCSVIGLDNFDPFYDPSIKRQQLENILNTNANKENVEFAECDIVNEAQLKKLFKGRSIDCVIHLAALAGVRPSIEQPDRYFNVNLLGTVNILEKCRTYGVPKIIFGSSSSVYGGTTLIPFSENDPTVKPISPYAASKRAAELACYTYHHLYDLKIAALRFFTVYGPRQRPDLAIHKFAHLIDEGKAIPKFGDGTSQRDYTYIADIVSGVEKSLNWLESQSSPIFEIFNLGNSTPTSLNQLIQFLERALRKKALIDAQPDQPGDMRITFADISKARQMLGYAPVTPMEEGIGEFVRWFKNRMR